MAKDSSSGLSFGLAGGADTIVARATPAGRGGLAVVRLSGTESARIASALSAEIDFRRGWRAQLVRLRGVDGAALDRGVVIPYSSPRSYTGEDMLEVMVHGSPYLVRALVEACVAAGAREAEPGEFTRRAVANGKMDLLQAEGVRDLIEAETAWQARVAREQVGGALSERLLEIRSGLVELLALVEGAIDFAEDEVELEVADLEARRQRLRAQIDSLAATGEVGERLREGVRVVIVGEPNAGKSTLFNALLGCERTIVAPQPGTTRDLVEGVLDVGGIRVVLVDGAGVRSCDDPVEAEGVRRVEEAAAGADAVIVVWPVDRPAPPRWPRGVPHVGVRSKVDLGDERKGESDLEEWVGVSAVTGEGWAALERALREMVGVPDTAGDGLAVARRHQRCLEAASRELRECRVCEPEVGAEHLRWALGHLGEVAGGVGCEEVLDRVFETFCIGK